MAHDICSQCGTRGTLLEYIANTTGVDYFRCACGQVWSVERPPNEPTVRVVSPVRQSPVGRSVATAPRCTPCDQPARLLPFVSNHAWVDYYRCDSCSAVLACEKDSSTVIHVAALLCTLCCGELWVCEQHPSKPWPHSGCHSRGAPCPVCQDPKHPPALPHDWRPLISTDDE